MEPNTNFLLDSDVYTTCDLLKLIAQDGGTAIVLSSILNNENKNKFLSAYNLKDAFEKWEKDVQNNDLDDNIKQIAQSQVINFEWKYI